MSRSTHLDAVYHDGVNKDLIGRQSVDLVKGHQYNIEVEQGWFGKIIVNPCHGYEWKHYADMTMVYPSLHHFLHDWEPRTLHHPFSHKFNPGGSAQ